VCECAQLRRMDQSTTVKVKYCFAFQKGECRRGDKCKYSHSSSNSLATQSKSKECFAFQRGDCRYGDKCRYNHDSHLSVAAAASSSLLLSLPASTLTPKPPAEVSIHAKEAEFLQNDMKACTIQSEKSGTTDRNDNTTGAKKTMTPTTQQQHTLSEETEDFPSVIPRPQMDIPGFEGILSCCTDWPQTKKGGPPGAQSAIFNPLLACTLGQIPGYCSPQQVEYAVLWWTAVFPAFPRWIHELRAAGLTLESPHGKRLIGSVTVPRSKKGNKNSNNNNIGTSSTSNDNDDTCITNNTNLKAATSSTTPLASIHNSSNGNNLIFKHSKAMHGEVPHFKGKAQNAALELCPMVAVEVYACVTCLYSVAT
jgi:hypothetical protein